MKLNFIYINLFETEYKENDVVCQRNNAKTTSLVSYHLAGGNYR